MIRNCRHLISTNEKFTKKFSYDEIIPNTTKLPESVAPPQTANLPKPVTLSTTINPSKSVASSGAKVTRSGRVSVKPNSILNSVEMC